MALRYHETFLNSFSWHFQLCWTRFVNRKVNKNIMYFI